MDDRMMDMNEVTRVLGVSVRTVRRWLAKSTSPIPFHRVGGRLKARQSDVAAWLRSLGIGGGKP